MTLPQQRSLWGTAAVSLLAATIVEMVSHGGAAIWAGLAGLIGPDLAFLIGVGQPNQPGLLPARAVPAYNLLHRVWLPVIMLAAAIAADPSHGHAAPYVTASLGWLAHIALDRALGFRLRAADGSIRPANSATPTQAPKRRRTKEPANDFDHPGD
jgi:hypothetical protein